jgi:hypothetical protein
MDMLVYTISFLLLSVYLAYHQLTLMQLEVFALVVSTVAVAYGPLLYLHK